MKKRKVNQRANYIISGTIYSPVLVLMGISALVFAIINLLKFPLIPLLTGERYSFKKWWDDAKNFTKHVFEM